VKVLAIGIQTHELGADIFFDDQKGHCESAVQQQVAAAHVPHGVVNQKKILRACVICNYALHIIV
jgi:hypothetical protein